MKSVEEFQAFYRTTLVPVAEALEGERKTLIKKIYLAVAAGIVFIVVYGIFSDPVVTDTQMGPGGPSQVSDPGGVTRALFYVAITGALGYFFWYKPQSEALARRYKMEVVGRIVKFVDPGLDYQPSGGISRSEYMSSTIFTTTGDRFLSEDLVSGKVGNTAIRFSEVHAQQKLQESGRNSSSFNSYETLFKGVIFIADFNKHFKGRTVVLTDQAERALGSFGTIFQKMNSMRDPLVKMENPEFEKAFVVYSTDAVEAHYILSPSLMDRILLLRTKLGAIQLAFYDSVVFISIPFRDKLFEASIFKSQGVYRPMENYFTQLQLFTGVVEELNLNNRIWTKE